MLVLFFADKQTCTPFIVPVCDFSVEFSDLYGILGLFAVQVFISTARKIGVWLSLVERYVRDVEAASSNLVTPTWMRCRKPLILLVSGICHFVIKPLFWLRFG